MLCVSVEDVTRARTELQVNADNGTPFDIVILSAELPGDQWFELAYFITRTPGFAAVRLILLTASVRRGAATKTLGEGIASYLAKPVQQGKLHKCLAMLVRLPQHRAAANPSAGITGLPPDISRSTRHTLVESSGHLRVRILVVEDDRINRLVDCNS